MQPLHTRFVDEITRERGRVHSRRALLGAGGKVAAVGTLGAALAGSGAFARAEIALAQDFADDIAILNYALTLEHLENAFYRDGLAEIGKDGFDESMGQDTFDLLTAIGGHEQAHVDALVETISSLGGQPVAEATYDFGYEDAAGFIEVAMTLENTGVAAYAGAAPSIADEGLLSTALGIHSVEARHAAFLNTLNASSPFPEAVDMPLTMDEVLETAGGFVVSQGSSGTPEGGATQAGEATAVGIDNFKFSPDTLEIAIGTEVTWTNMELSPHSVVAEDGSFESETLSDGDSFSFTFDTAGTFPYICGIHTSMKGEVIVS